MNRLKVLFSRRTWIFKMSRCIIVSAARLEADFNKEGYIHGDEYIICADGGYDNALKLGLQPNLLVGDMDSIKTLPTGVETVPVPAEKDDTDTMLAVKLAIERGYHHITILGGVGGRLDHVFANIQTLLYCAERGVEALLAGSRNSAFVLINGTRVLKAVADSFVSVFSLSPCCDGVTLKGLRYPLTDAHLVNSFPLGVSNEFRQEYAEITVGDGTLLVILSSKQQY